MFDFIKSRRYEYKVAIPIADIQQKLGETFELAELDRMRTAKSIVSGFFLDAEKKNFIIKSSGGWIISIAVYSGSLAELDYDRTAILLKSDSMLPRYVAFALIICGLANGIHYASQQPLMFWFEGTTWLWIVLITWLLFFARGISVGLDETLKASFEKIVFSHKGR